MHKPLLSSVLIILAVSPCGRASDPSPSACASSVLSCIKSSPYHDPRSIDECIAPFFPQCCHALKPTGLKIPCGADAIPDNSAAEASAVPALPSMWSAETKDPPLEDAEEHYHFVVKSSDDDLRAHAFTDLQSNCTKIMVDDSFAKPAVWGKRDYYIGCEATAGCCYVDDDSQKEWQLRPSKAKPAGTKNITSFDETIEAEGWKDSYFALTEIVTYTYWITRNSSNEIEIHRIDIIGAGLPPLDINLQFRNFVSFDESDALKFNADYFVAPLTAAKCDEAGMCPPDKARKPARVISNSAYSKAVEVLSKL